MQTDPTPVRTARHQAVEGMAAAAHLMTGQPGMDKGQQLLALTTARFILTAVIEVLDRTVATVAERDEEAHAAAKAEFNALASAVDEAMGAEDL